MQRQNQWYEAEEGEQCLDPARKAFEEAIVIFGRITNDARKKTLVQQATSLEDLQKTIDMAKSRYEEPHKGHKVCKWLLKFSHRVQYYGNIMDVMMQQHPEYVSLAWGTMKLLFVLVENHGKLVTTLAKGLSQIADSLPRIELVTILYPTRRVKQAVAELYAYILRFFIRVQEWFEQGKLRHAWEALARPVELRYDDLIEEIEGRTSDIDKLANAGAQAEQRDIHLELQELIRRQAQSDTIMLEMRQSIILSESLHSSSFLDTNMRLTDLQLNQIMNYVSSAGKLDSIKSLQYCAFVCNRRGFTSSTVVADDCSALWSHPKFNRWKSQQLPALLMIKGDYRRRFAVKKFCVSVVELLRSISVPVIWTLKTSRARDASGLSIIDLVKDLVCQALRLNISLRTEKSLSLSCAQFRAAQTEGEWFELLGTVIATFSQLYIVVDIEAVDIAYAGKNSSFSWLSAFTSLFRDHTRRQCKTSLKVILVSYGSASVQETKLANFQEFIINTRISRPGSCRWQGKMPSASRRRGTLIVNKGRRGHNPII